MISYECKADSSHYAIRQEVHKMSLHEQLKELNSAKQFEEICALYDSSSTGDAVWASEWDYVYLMLGLYKQKRYRDCLDLYKKFVVKFPGNDKLDSKMGWCVYHLFVKSYDFSVREAEEEARKKVEYVLKKVKDGKYAPIWSIVNHVTKGILGRQKKNQEDYSQCSWYLECVDRSSLKREGYILAEGGRQAPSDYELWFCKKTKCLEGLGAYSECIRLCDEGLATIPTFHSNIDIWLQRRKANCLLRMGKIEEAGYVAAEILSSGFNNWVAYDMLYDVALAEGKPEEAMKYAGCCALADPQHSMRVNFYKKYAAFLDIRGLSREAMLHRRLVVLLKEEKDWRIKFEDLQGISDEIKAWGIKEVMPELRRFWEKHRDQGKVYVFGKIAKVFPEKRHGWVQDEKGQEYFFRFMDAKGSPDCLQACNNVLFIGGKRMDPKYKVVKENAVEVKLRSNRG